MKNNKTKIEWKQKKKKKNEQTKLFRNKTTINKGKKIQTKKLKRHISASCQ